MQQILYLYLMMLVYAWLSIPAAVDWIFWNPPAEGRVADEPMKDMRGNLRVWPMSGLVSETEARVVQVIQKPHFYRAIYKDINLWL